MKVSAPFEPAICVRNFDRALAFYRDALGMVVFSIDEIPPELSQRANLTHQGYRIARLETSNGDRLKLVAPRELPPPHEPEDYVLGRHGFAYLTFIVPDLSVIIERLKAAGAPMRTGGGPINFLPGVQLIFAEDPEGNFLEFVQREDLATYRPARGA